jgi:hypothetical protein
MNIFVVALLPVLFLANSSEQAKVANNKPEVEFHNGRISVKAEDVALKEVLQEIEKKSGIEIELKDAKAAEKSVSIDVKDVMPRRVFRQILHGLNFAYFHSRTGLARVLILAPGGTPPEGYRKPFGRGLRRKRWQRRSRNFREMLSEKSVKEKLAKVATMQADEDARSIEELGMALTDKDPEVKEKALEVLVDKEEGDSITNALRRGLSDPDPEFRIEILEALAEQGDLDSLRAALNDPDPEVREEAADLLESAAP